MIAIARGITRFDGRAAFSTWCYRIATNAAIDELRRTAPPTGPRASRRARTGGDRLGPRRVVAARARRRRRAPARPRGVPGGGRAARPVRPRLRGDRRGRSTSRPAPCGRGSPGAARSSWNDSDRARRTCIPGPALQGTRYPPANVRTTMADDERPDARDPRVAGWLEVEPLDDVTRRRLVSTALREPRPPTRRPPDARPGPGGGSRPRPPRWWSRRRHARGRHRQRRPRRAAGHGAGPHPGGARGTRRRRLGSTRRRGLRRPRRARQPRLLARRARLPAQCSDAGRTTGRRRLRRRQRLAVRANAAAPGRRSRSAACPSPTAPSSPRATGTLDGRRATVVLIETRRRQASLDAVLRGSVRAPPPLRLRG